MHYVLDLLNPFIVYTKTEYQPKCYPYQYRAYAYNAQHQTTRLHLYVDRLIFDE